ncbi:hypothetical protein LEP1GSC035_4692 [Leptospira noguchii str. 2007001578]|uniref:Uncharacterized protein n=1 Tax=Leptospira noguchii str. 2007001578 TaxID=1049974 RepID=A0ABP2TA08_9LEPT|nr:hypothetical protein LEP1GSC035_4692 [Leptospira noguchii str. 2007001578]
MLGEAVRDKRSGQKMYVEVAWNPEVSCVTLMQRRRSS